MNAESQVINLIAINRLRMDLDKINARMVMFGTSERELAELRLLQSRLKGMIDGHEKKAG